MQSLDDRASGASKNEGAGERRFARRNRLIVALALVLLATLGVLYFRTVQSFERATFASSTTPASRPSGSTCSQNMSRCFVRRS